MPGMEMSLWAVAACALLSITAEVTADFDLYSPDGGDYEFVYHELSNLMLTFHGNSCYFAYLDPSMQKHLQEGDVFMQMQKQIQTIIETDDSPQKYKSSLDEARTQFLDVLADFRCSEDLVFMMWIDYLECDFQAYQSLCGWHDNLQGTLFWQLHKGATLTPLTGPDSDHTLGTHEGQYLYLEANEGQAGQEAEVVSPVLHLAEPLCLRFWFHMRGTGVGHLTVYTEHPEQNGPNTTLWHLSGNQGNVWRQGEVTVPPVPGAGAVAGVVAPTRIHLQATRGGDMYGDIAIDDISSLPGVCSPDMLDCSFEATEGLCLWSQGGSGVTMDWLTHSGPTDTAGTGPDSALHTVNGAPNLSYLYVEGDAAGPGEVAELLSPPFFLPTPLCLRFWYCMKGAGVHRLALLLRRKGSNSERLLWYRLGPQPQATWTQVHLTLHPDPDHPHVPQRVAIRAVRGMSPLSDIAIDLVRATSGPCGVEVHTSTVTVIG
ncbi:MAM and LDL-receptor class A domain-containing protein 1-like [Babylonia areolata]|uniref:MAM and LDL-receptor class A domain-containing protein 1-like n=1 Tax=Babylonia areolata TaxID=304850 RepID=UPI003FD46293